MSKQSGLEVLNLNSNYFASTSTQKVLTRITDCGLTNNLKELSISTANFDSDQVVEKLADVLVISPKLTDCDITN